MQYWIIWKETWLIVQGYSNKMGPEKNEERHLPISDLDNTNVWLLKMGCYMVRMSSSDIYGSCPGACEWPWGRMTSVAGLAGGPPIGSNSAQASDCSKWPVPGQRCSRFWKCQHWSPRCITLFSKSFVKVLVSIVLISVVNTHHVFPLLMGRDKETREDYISP